jgi:hypothetical protein
VIGVKYGSYDMQGGGSVVTDTDVYSAPPNSIQADALAELDGSLIVKQRYTSKTFRVEGYLRADSIAALETLIDTFKRAMSVKNQAFDIDYAGGIRRYLASSQNTMISKSSLTTAGFTVEFLSPDGMGWSLDSTALVTPTGITTSSASIPLTVAGSYQCEPKISVKLNTLSGGTTKTISITNDATLRGISVTRTWVAGDLLEIDSLAKTVFVNDIPVEFKGQFLTWAVGAGAVGYLDDLTARDATITASYTRRWL